MPWGWVGVAGWGGKLRHGRAGGCGALGDARPAEPSLPPTRQSRDGVADPILQMGTARR